MTIRISEIEKEITDKSQLASDDLLLISKDESGVMTSEKLTLGVLSNYINK